MTVPKPQKPKIIDCRALPPPEPLIKVMQAVEQMQPGDTIKMLHRQKPCLLLPKLEERGLQYELKEFDDGSIELLIWWDEP